MSIAAGSFNTRIRIMTRAPGQDAAGQPQNTWIEHAWRWANMLSVNGKAAIQANADEAVRKVSVRVRWCTDITAGMRVEHAGVVYDIKLVLPDLQARQHVDLVCEEVP